MSGARSSRRMLAIVVGLVMAAGLPAAHFARPTVHMSDTGPKVALEAMFPASFGEWRTDDSLPVILPSPDVQALLNSIYNQMLSRTYINPRGERIMLSVAYGGDQSDGTRAHRPEVCYPAQGFQITSSEIGEIALPGGPLRVRQLMSRLGNRFEPITYWVMVGERPALSGTEQKLAQLRFGLRGVIPDGMLVRVSSIDQDKDRGLRLQERFVTEMATAIDPGWRPRVLGSAATP